MKQTLKEAGYTFHKKVGKEYQLMNESGGIEIFVANKNHASWGLKYKNTHLEFCSSMLYPQFLMRGIK